MTDENGPGARLHIPNKLYFRIGEVSEITGAQPYVLRHWEMEFPTLSPKKNPSGQRLYRREDIEMVREIQRLLHHEGYTTAGARRLLTQRTKGAPAAPAAPPPAPAAPLPPAPGDPPLGPVEEALALMQRNDDRLRRLAPPGEPEDAG